MSNEIKNYRSAIAQGDRNKSMYAFMIIEILIFSIVLGAIPGYIYDSDRVTVMSFVFIASALIVGLCVPMLRFITFIILGFGWAAPFVLFGWWIGDGWAFYGVGIMAFFASFLIHYWATTYLDDLGRLDN